MRMGQVSIPQYKQLPPQGQRLCLYSGGAAWVLLSVFPEDSRADLSFFILDALFDCLSAHAGAYSHLSLREA